MGKIVFDSTIRINIEGCRQEQRKQMVTILEELGQVISGSTGIRNPKYTYTYFYLSGGGTTWCGSMGRHMKGRTNITLEDFCKTYGTPTINLNEVYNNANTIL